MMMITMMAMLMMIVAVVLMMISVQDRTFYFSKIENEQWLLARWAMVMKTVMMMMMTTTTMTMTAVIITIILLGPYMHTHTPLSMLLLERPPVFTPAPQYVGYFRYEAGKHGLENWIECRLVTVGARDVEHRFDWSVFEIWILIEPHQVRWLIRKLCAHFLALIWNRQNIVFVCGKMHVLNCVTMTMLYV